MFVPAGTSAWTEAWATSHRMPSDSNSTHTLTVPTVAPSSPVYYVLSASAPVKPSPDEVRAGASFGSNTRSAVPSSTTGAAPATSGTTQEPIVRRYSYSTARQSASRPMRPTYAPSGAVTDKPRTMRPTYAPKGNSAVIRAADQSTATITRSVVDTVASSCMTAAPAAVVPVAHAAGAFLAIQPL